MARGKNPGDDFDNQYNQSRRRAEPKKQAGQSHWADDKAIRDAGRLREPSGEEKGCGKATLYAVGLGGGFAYAMELVRGLIV